MSQKPPLTQTRLLSYRDSPCGAAHCCVSLVLFPKQLLYQNSEPFCLSSRMRFRRILKLSFLCLGFPTSSWGICGDLGVVPGEGIVWGGKESLRWILLDTTAAPPGKCSTGSVGRNCGIDLSRAISAFQFCFVFFNCMGRSIFAMADVLLCFHYQLCVPGMIGKVF